MRLQARDAEREEAWQCQQYDHLHDKRLMGKTVFLIMRTTKDS